MHLHFYSNPFYTNDSFIEYLYNVLKKLYKFPKKAIRFILKNYSLKITYLKSLVMLNLTKTHFRLFF